MGNRGTDSLRSRGKPVAEEGTEHRSHKFQARALHSGVQTIPTFGTLLKRGEGREGERKHANIEFIALPSVRKAEVENIKMQIKIQLQIFQKVISNKYFRSSLNIFC